MANLYRPTAVFFLLFAFPCAYAVSPAADGSKEPSSAAISKDAYEAVRRSYKAIVEDMRRLGLSWDDIDPNNLPFSSNTVEECLQTGRATAVGRDEKTVVAIACIKRHETTGSADMLRLLMNIEIGRLRDAGRQPRGDC